MNSHAFDQTLDAAGASAMDSIGVLAMPPARNSPHERITADPKPESWQTMTMATIQSKGISQASVLGSYPEKPYSFHRIVGVGGFGEVWEASQNALGRKVAIKRVKRGLRGVTESASAQSAQVTQSFRQEALITACLDHPNIVPIYDMGIDEAGQPMLAMKLVRGNPWDRVIKDDAELTLSAKLGKHLPILIDMAQAVAFAHSKGVIHRDVKPSQVMVGEFGEVLLMDWGLAVSYRPEEGAGANLFAGQHQPMPLDMASNPAGTPAFMAPEQTEDTTENLGPWTDVFLVGATLYLLLAGQPPYYGGSAREVLEMAGAHKLVSPQQIAGPDVALPPELVRICMKAMAREPWQRYASVRDLLAELQDYVLGAGKRRESYQLTNSAMELLSRAEGDYAMLTEAIRDIDQALALFPANDEADALSEKSLVDFARAALAKGDFDLARFRAGAIRNDAIKTELKGRIKTAIDERARHEQRSRNYALATAILIVVTMVMAMWALDSRFRLAKVEQVQGTVSIAEAP